MKANFNLQKLVRDNITNLKPYSSARDEYSEQGKQMVFLDANENPFDNGLNRYPGPQQKSLKKMLAEIKAISTGKILLGNGSDEVLDLILRAFCEPKVDNIITLPPTYGMYNVLANINNVENKEVFLLADFEPDVKQIFNTVDDNTKIIFLCSPNNPTGNSFSEEMVHEILINFSGLVVIDEAYMDFSEKESWLNKLVEFPNLIITQTLSKAYGMAGIRLGICYASEEIIKILNKIKPPYNVNELTQRKALERLKSTELVCVEVHKIKAEREILKLKLQEIHFIRKIYPSDANFLLVEVDDACKRYEQLLNKGIVVRNRNNQPLCKNTLRFTVGTVAENKKLIKALQEI